MKRLLKIEPGFHGWPHSFEVLCQLRDPLGKPAHLSQVALEALIAVQQSRDSAHQLNAGVGPGGEGGASFLMGLMLGSL